MNLFKKKPSTGTSAVDTYLIVGLGNPGREYRDTRHNVGFMCVDKISETLNIPMSRVQAKAIIGSKKVGDLKILLAKPQTYMNASGQAVGALSKFYKVPPENILVIHDDLDLPLGTLRLRPGGGSGGQKGVASIMQHLGTQEFPRMRFGIDRPPGRMDAAAYVLQNFNAAELEILEITLRKAAEAAQSFYQHGLNHAMNHYNGSI
ncbi:MAG: aminoacyl-tRNA hydrolase [Anaerolineaceae bacterium]|nr:aminoacyl-tRNA hydrolase [Anaerolineaceae bacterium]